MSKTRAELIYSIQQFLLIRGVMVDDTIIENHNFIREGSLDSFEILTLIMQLESELCIPIPIELLLEQGNTEIGKLVDSLVKLANDRDKS